MSVGREDAVSPVIGILLMLVVTIIIAAVVSGFAGGLAGDQQKAPQSSVNAISDIISIQDTNIKNYKSDYPTDFVADNGILFEHNGGDGFALNDIMIQLQDDDTKITISNSDKLPSAKCTSSAVTAYFMEIGSSDGFIKSGDKFKLYADNCYDASEGEYEYPTGTINSAPKPPCITWKPEGSVDGGIAIFTDKKSNYKIIDRVSQKVISQGSISLHQ